MSPIAAGAMSSWLLELRSSCEMECTAILYAKSLLETTKQSDKFNTFNEQYGGLARNSFMSSSMQLNEAPAKPLRRMSRLTASTSCLPTCAPPPPPILAPKPAPWRQNGTTQPAAGIQAVRRMSNASVASWSSQGSIAMRKRSPPKYSQLRFSYIEEEPVPESSPNRRSMPPQTTVTNENDSGFVDDAQKCSCGVSPDSSNDSSSVDSGACSADRSASSNNFAVDCYAGQSGGGPNSAILPSYPKMASTMDHVLRTSSAIYTLMGAAGSPAVARELLAKAVVFIQLMEASACAPFLPYQDIATVRASIESINAGELNEQGITNFFVILLRKVVEQALQIFTRIISRYLIQCVNKDRLLTIALEHLIHITLFGDELCLETIQNGGLTAILSFCRMTTTPSETLRLLLRAMAVLCGVSKGCIQLLSMAGLDTVVQILCNGNIACSVEAAGVLTQLTNPTHAFAKLHTLIPQIVTRLLDVIDESHSAEALLLCTAAIANLTLQQPSVVELLYRYNAILRIISAFNQPNCSTIFVQEQVATILSRLAARDYEEALIAQGAIPVLLKMLTSEHPQHSDYCRRIRYKAAVCIGTLASKGRGLKALHQNKAYESLCRVLDMEQSRSNPLVMICENIRDRLESKYQLESAV